MNTINSLKLKLSTVRTMNQEDQTDNLVQSELDDLVELKVEMFMLADTYVYEEVDANVLRLVVASSDWILPINPNVSDDELREAVIEQFGENLIFVLNGLQKLIEVDES